MQVADVKKALGSVREMVQAGIKVVFDEDARGNSCIYLDREATGRRTVMYGRNGTFQFDIKVPKGNGHEVEEVTRRAKEGCPRQGALMADLFY